MNRSRQILIAAAVIIVAIAAYAIFAPAKPLVLTGIVTTNDVIVSPQVSGQVQKLLVNEGDSVVPGQLLAVISAGELAAGGWVLSVIRSVEDPVQLALDHSVALACDRFEAGAIDDGDLAAVVPDETRRLKDPGGQGSPLPGGSRASGQGTRG